jgi:hypothetical protein
MEIGRFLEIVCEHCSVYRKSDGPYRDRYEWVSHKNEEIPTSDDYLYQQWYLVWSPLYHIYKDRMDDA